jgi:phosphohistidine swiveling domain-containing protein
MNEIEQLTWKKNWAGKWTLLECCHFGREYTELLAARYEVGPEHTLFTIENGSSADFLVPDEVKAFTDNLVAKVNEDHGVATQWANTITASVDSVLEFARSFESKKIDKEDFETLWKKLDDYLLVHFPIKKVVDYLPQEVLTQVLPILEKARVYAEPVYAESLKFVRKFAEDNAAMFGVAPELFLCMTLDEMEAAFRDRQALPEAILKERYAFSVLVVVHGQSRIISGQEAKALAEKTVHRTEESMRTIKGMTAFPGKVQGRVQIVFNPAEISSLPSGTVLVAGMTRPDYLHLFKAAIAVVTDAGGVLSHAAITARELNKPTVTGTEIATKVLKDGDLVEVDADKGLITRLNQ